MVLSIISDLKNSEILSICDHTFLFTADYYKAIAKDGENPILKREWEFNRFLNQTINSDILPYAICVRSDDVRYCFEKLIEKNKKDKIKIVSVSGFPDGRRFSIEDKILEADRAFLKGADEIDFVINYQKIKEKDFDYLKRELGEMSYFGIYRKVPVKIILECSELNKGEIAEICKMANEYEGISFIKTSTGFSSSGAKEDDLKIIRQNYKRGIKASGGVNKSNLFKIIRAMSGRNDGYIELDPMKVRIGESSLMNQLLSYKRDEKSY